MNTDLTFITNEKNQNFKEGFLNGFWKDIRMKQRDSELDKGWVQKERECSIS